MFIVRIHLFICLLLILYVAHYFYITVNLAQKVSTIPNKTVQITGTLMDIPEYLPAKSAFILKTDEINHESQTILLRLNWYGPRPILWASDNWQLTAKLKAAKPGELYADFDYGKWLLEQGISASGYVVKSYANQHLQNNRTYWLLNLRQTIAWKIFRLLKDKRAAAVIVALTVGSRAYIHESMWMLLQNTGTNHLIAIAGLHVGVLVFIGFWLFKNSWRLFPSALLCCSADSIGWLGAFIFGLIYSALAGFAIPTQRALIMLL